MASAIWSLLAGAVFGLALAAPPGPMNAVIAEESVRNGWTAGFRAGLGAMAADATFFVLALLGLVGIVQRAPTIRGVMVGIGGGLMLYFAYGAARGASTFVRAGDRTSHDAGSATDRASDGEDHRASDSEGDHANDRTRNEGTSRGFRKAFALAITNPYQLLFWLTVGVRLLEPGTVDVFAQSPVGDALAGQLIVETGSPALVVGFFGGIVAWILALPTALTRARHRLEAAAPIVAGASALVLAGYGVVFLVDAVTTLSG